MTDIDAGQDRTAEPVSGFGSFTWRTGAWERLFDRQIEAVKDDLARAHAEDRAVVYLSCPVSSRGGGWSRTNAEIAHFTARRLTQRWGERLFVLNPAEYQMESRAGTGRILQHVQREWPHEDPDVILQQLLGQYRPGGGDYMRMWVKVLVEDDRYRDGPGAEKPKQRQSCGGMFDAFYFLGPTDVWSFFAADRDASITELVESYFARKYATDIEFRREFDTRSASQDGSDRVWEQPRKEFFRYYALRASAAYSLGSHDEWNTLVRLNATRRQSPAYGPGEEIACYFDGRQVSPAADGYLVAPGYEVRSSERATDVVDLVGPDFGRAAPAAPPREVAWPTGMFATTGRVL
jgi:hypothetical protein